MRYGKVDGVHVTQHVLQLLRARHHALLQFAVQSAHSLLGIVRCGGALVRTPRLEHEQAQQHRERQPDDEH